MGQRLEPHVTYAHEEWAGNTPRGNTPTYDYFYCSFQKNGLTLTVLIATIDAQWERMGDVGSARYEPALLPPCPTIRVLSYSN